MSQNSVRLHEEEIIFYSFSFDRYGPKMSIGNKCPITICLLMYLNCCKIFIYFIVMMWLTCVETIPYPHVIWKSFILSRSVYIRYPWAIQRYIFITITLSILLELFVWFHVFKFFLSIAVYKSYIIICHVFLFIYIHSSKTFRIL